ncbi:MAG: hypothetical protein V3S01_12905, partial [Dehalococcoidia bacterium]
VGLGRDSVRLLAEGEPLIVVDESIETRWTVHPFLFEVLRPFDKAPATAGRQDDRPLARRILAAKCAMCMS